MKPKPLPAEIRRRKLSAYLMLGFMVVWIFSMLALEMTLGFQRGFGTGFGDGGHVPGDIVAAAGVGSNVNDVVAATSHNVGDTSIWMDIVLIAGSIATMLGITYVWYLIMSRIGTF